MIWTHKKKKQLNDNCSLSSCTEWLTWKSQHFMSLRKGKKKTLFQSKHRIWWIISNYSDNLRKAYILYILKLYYFYQCSVFFCKISISFQLNVYFNMWKLERTNSLYFILVGYLVKDEITQIFSSSLLPSFNGTYINRFILTKKRGRGGEINTVIRIGYLDYSLDVARIMVYLQVDLFTLLSFSCTVCL